MVGGRGEEAECVLEEGTEVIVVVEDGGEAAEVVAGALGVLEGSGMVGTSEDIGG